MLENTALTCVNYRADAGQMWISFVTCYESFVVFLSNTFKHGELTISIMIFTHAQDLPKRIAAHQGGAWHGKQMIHRISRVEMFEMFTYHNV